MENLNNKSNRRLTYTHRSGESGEIETEMETTSSILGLGDEFYNMDDWGQIKTLIEMFESAKAKANSEADEKTSNKMFATWVSNEFRFTEYSFSKEFKLSLAEQIIKLYNDLISMKQLKKFFDENVIWKEKNLEELIESENKEKKSENLSDTQKGFNSRIENLYNRGIIDFKEVSKLRDYYYGLSKKEQLVLDKDDSEIKNILDKIKPNKSNSKPKSRFLFFLKRKKNISISILIITTLKIAIHYFLYPSTKWIPKEYRFNLDTGKSMLMGGGKYGNEPESFAYHIENVFSEQLFLFPVIIFIYILIIWFFNDKIKAR